jgi:hypothetical protein
VRVKMRGIFNVSESITCNICWESFNSPAEPNTSLLECLTPRCPAIYCKACITQWIECVTRRAPYLPPTHRQFRCPLCQTSNSYSRLYALGCQPVVNDILNTMHIHQQHTLNKFSSVILALYIGGQCVLDIGIFRTLLKHKNPYSSNTFTSQHTPPQCVIDILHFLILTYTMALFSSCVFFYIFSFVSVNILNAQVARTDRRSNYGMFLLLIGYVRVIQLMHFLYIQNTCGYRWYAV